MAEIGHMKTRSTQWCSLALLLLTMSIIPSCPARLTSDSSDTPRTLSNTLRHSRTARSPEIPRHFRTLKRNSQNTPHARTVLGGALPADRSESPRDAHQAPLDFWKSRDDSKAAGSSDAQAALNSWTSRDASQAAGSSARRDLAGVPEPEGAGEEPARNVTLRYLRRTVGALQAAMDFFQRQHVDVNLDAVIGTRIVEGTLKVLLSNLERHHQTALLPVDVLAGIRALYVVSKRVSDQAEPNVERSQPTYYQRIGPAIHEGLWELDYSSRTLTQGLPSWRYTPSEAMSEKESDDCLTELFGTSGKTDRECVISDKCWTRMTTYGYSQYSLSHQIFYLQIGEKAGCLPQMLWKILMHDQPGLHVLQDTYCANMLREALDISRAGYPASHQDLFMEQAALCGLYGYKEFFYYQWLDKMLGWQDSHTGCFKWAGWPLQRMGATQQKHHVSKREEKRLDNGCLCHRTTVAAAGLVQYVRFLTEALVA